MSAILTDLDRVHYFPTAGSPATLSGMDSRDLTKAQAEVLLSRIWPMLNYLNRLKQRMERRRFPTGDKLYSRVVAAHNDLHSLAITLHWAVKTQRFRSSLS